MLPFLVCAAVVFELRQGSAYTRGNMVFLRDLVASSECYTPGILYQSPDDLASLGFEFDGQQEAQWLRKQSVETLSESEVALASRATGDTLTKAQQIVRAFSKSACDPEVVKLKLVPKIHAVHEGHGLCSDHTQVLMALATAAGITVREVQNMNHGFCEVYLPERKQWAHIDPEWALYVVDETNRPLSSLELRYRKQHGQPWKVVCFGTAPTSPKSAQDERVIRYYMDSTAFQRLAYGKGNRVISVAQANVHNPLPWEFRKLWVAFTDRSAKLYEVNDADNAGISLARVRWRFGLYAVSSVITLGYLYVFLLPWISPRLRGHRSGSR